MTILRALRAIPRETNVVFYSNVPIYSDAAAVHLIGDAKAVILQTTSPGGTQKSLRIFPTTKDHFKKGEQVSWEWSMDRKWGETWYKDPETSEIKKAWHSSAEFIGRPLGAW
jgi:hypothetical protein